MHHGTCVTHVPWCMSGSLTRGDGENVPGIPGACAPAILRIWQEAHCKACTEVNVIYFDCPLRYCFTINMPNRSCLLWKYAQRHINAEILPLDAHLYPPYFTNRHGSVTSSLHEYQSGNKQFIWLSVMKIIGKIENCEMRRLIIPNEILNPTALKF